MFEKEAEEWIMNNSKNIINKVSNGETNLFGIAEQAYQKSSEFGYNKANEWHSPKEKLPTEDCEVLIEYDDHKIHRVVDWDNKSKRFGGLSIDEVTWWKEIVLPKESE